MNLYDEVYAKLKQQGFSEEEIQRVLKERHQTETSEEQHERLNKQCIEILRSWFECKQ